MDDNFETNTEIAVEMVDGRKFMELPIALRFIVISFFDRASKIHLRASFIFVEVHCLARDNVIAARCISMQSRESKIAVLASIPISRYRSQLLLLRWLQRSRGN